MFTLSIVVLLTTHISISNSESIFKEAVGALAFNITYFTSNSSFCKNSKSSTNDPNVNAILFLSRLLIRDNGPSLTNDDSLE